LARIGFEVAHHFKHRHAPEPRAVATEVSHRLAKIVGGDRVERIHGGIF